MGVPEAPPGPAARLLERESELARLHEALLGAIEGRGTFIVVEGVAGIGKTQLVAAAREEARAAGLRVLTARGSELELDFGHGVVRQLLEPPVLGAPPAQREELLAGAASLAAGLFGLAPDSASGSQSPMVDPTFAVLHGLYWLCANLAQRGPLLLAVDDAHWADAPSLRFLAYLARRIDELPVVVICASRPADPSAHTEALAELVTDPAAELLHPGPLTRDGVAELVRAGLEGEPEERFVAACMAATGGIPFLVRELLLALRADETLPTADYARRVAELGPRAIARSILLRLGRLGHESGQLARALAVLGADAELRHAAALAGLSLDEAGRAADVLAAAGIVERSRPLQFVHPIVRTAIHADLPPSEREMRHARAARLFAAEGAPLDRVAAHLLASAPAGDVWVVERLQAAARAAIDQGAPESAVHYLTRALEEPAPPELRPHLLLDLGSAETHCGRPSTGAMHLQAALDTLERDEDILVAGHLLGRALALDERPREAITVFDSLMFRLDPESEQALALQAAIVAQAQIHDVPASLVTSQLEHLRATAVAGLDLPRAAYAVLAADAVFRCAPAEESAALARRSLEGSPRPFPSPFDPYLFFHGCIALLWSERYDEVRWYYDAAIQDAQRLGSAPRFAAASCGRALLAFRRGALAYSEDDARQTLDVLGGPHGFYGPLALSMLALCLMERGELEEAERWIEAAGEIGNRTSYSVTVLLIVRGRLRRLGGRVIEALADAREGGARLARMEVRSPAVVPWRSEAAVSLHALGRSEEAIALAAEEVALARQAGTQRALGTAQLAQALAAGGEVPALREAVATLAATQAALEHARALAELGAALRRSGSRAEAREHLRLALDVAHRCGATVLEHQARQELLASGARPRTSALTGFESLTPSERRVAQLAAAGRTNREIAQALFVTPRTVEGHLTNVYAKLGVGSREELAGVVPGGVDAADDG